MSRPTVDRAALLEQIIEARAAQARREKKYRPSDGDAPYLTDAALATAQLLQLAAIEEAIRELAQLLDHFIVMFAAHAKERP